MLLVKDNRRSALLRNPLYARGIPSGVSLREEKERAVTYQELRRVEGTSSAGKAQAPAVAAYYRTGGREGGKGGGYITQRVEKP